ncbi:MAG: long-chain fatty acid--CoA ligase [Euryarchaeota archaeon]|nr:long-chain fatty acid--CoA ligase [Euryarchaeota archaeon]
MERPWHKHWPTGVPKSIDYPRVPLHQLLRDTAKAHGDLTATMFYGATLTYRQVDDYADRLAAALRKMGVKKGDRVGVLLPNSPMFIIAFFGILRTGGIVVQTNPLYTPRELEQLYADSGATAVVCLDLFLPNLLKAKPNTNIQHVIVVDVKHWLPGLLGKLYPIKKKKDLKKAGHWPLVIPKQPWVHDFQALLQTPPEPGTEPPVDSVNDVAVLAYTGGTTGTPKGAMLTHFNLVANVYQGAAWIPHAKAGQERMLAAIPMFHAFGLTVAMLVPVKIGATIICHPNPREVDKVLKLVTKTKPTLFPGVPTMYIAMLNHPKLGRSNLRGIKACLSGAAPLPLEVRRKFEQLTGGKLVEGYGLTETSPITHANPLTEDGLVKECIGIPVPDTEARIVDPETGAKEMPVGEAGEIILRGPQVMKGYWNKPEETANVLRNGWLYTGDIAKMDEDGYFYIVERKKDMIIASGYNVYPREVEEVLFQHAAVQEAAVIGVPDPYRGETVKAFVVLKAGATATDLEIIAFCKERLAAFKVPKAIEFRTELPKSLVGKVLRRALREEELAKKAA